MADKKSFIFTNDRVCETYGKATCKDVVNNTLVAIGYDIIRNKPTIFINANSLVNRIELEKVPDLVNDIFNIANKYLSNKG